MLPLFSLNEQKWKNVKNEIKLPRGRLQFFIPCNLTYFYTLLPFIALFSSSRLHPAVSIPWLLSVYDTDTFQERKKTTFMMSPLSHFWYVLLQLMRHLTEYSYIECEEAGKGGCENWEVPKWRTLSNMSMEIL